jgi:hypothetical protein
LLIVGVAQSVVAPMRQNAACRPPINFHLFPKILPHAIEISAKRSNRAESMVVENRTQC